MAIETAEVVACLTTIRAASTTAGLMNGILSERTRYNRDDASDLWTRGVHQAIDCRRLGSQAWVSWRLKGHEASAASIQEERSTGFNGRRSVRGLRRVNPLYRLGDTWLIRPTESGQGSTLTVSSQGVEKNDGGNKRILNGNGGRCA
jgi:hypothetical protein